MVGLVGRVPFLTFPSLVGPALARWVNPWWPPMLLRTGETVERDGDYFGPPVNQTARLMAVGHGGQVLCSAVTAGLLGVSGATSGSWP